MPSTLQWCRCGRFRGRNLAESGAVRRRFRAGVGVFWQTLPIGPPSMRNLDEICLNNCRECGLEDTCFGKQRNVFMRVSPFHEQIFVLAQYVSYARIDRRQSCHRPWNFWHLVFKSPPRVLSQTIEQLEKIVSLIRRPVAFFTLPCLQTDLCGDATVISGPLQSFLRTMNRRSVQH